MVCMELRYDAIEAVNISSVWFCWSSMQILAMSSRGMWSGGFVMMSAMLWM